MKRRHLLTLLSGATPDWVPTDISGCILWLRGDNATLALLNDGDPVATWPDESGDGSDAVQAVGALQPFYIADTTMNSKPGVRFEAAQAITSTLVQPAVCTKFVVLNRTSGVFGFDQDGVACVTAGGDWKDVILYGHTADSKWNVSGDSTNFKSAVYGNRDATVVCGVFNGASSVNAVNGNVVTGDSGVAQAATSAHIGAMNAALGSPVHANVAEVIIYDSALSAGDRGTVEDYLGTKYGITIA